MKNIFFIINKEKVYAYAVSILTIVILFFMSHVMNSDVSNEVSADVESNNTSDNSIETGIVPN